MTKKSKIISIISLSLLFMFFYLLNFHTPLFDDDLYIGQHQTLITLWNQAYADYFHWNGRAIGQTLWRILVSSNIYITSLIISLGSIITIFLLNHFGKPNQSSSYSALRIVYSFSLVLLFAPVIGQTMFWRAGAGNYLLTTTLILLFILPYYQWFHQGQHHLTELSALLPLLAFLAGWSNENTSGGGLLIVLSYLLAGRYFKKLSWSKIQISSVITYLIGYLFLILAPGNAIRTKATMPPSWFEQSTFTHFKNGFKLVSKTLFHDYKMLIALILIFALVVIFQRQLENAIEGLLWFAAGLAVLYALSISPLGQDGGRSFFGGIIFMIVALLKLSTSAINHYQKKTLAYLTGATFLVLLTMLGLLKGAMGTLDAIKANQALQTRYQELEKHQGSDKLVKVKPLSYYPKKSFAINYGLEELSNSDPHAFPNEGYNWHYNLKKGIIMK